MKVVEIGKRHRTRMLTYFMAFIAVFITIAMVQYPKEAFDSALVGLSLWWNVVFPALLPFFILSEILMGLGVVHFIGILLEPLMRPVFNVPGLVPLHCQWDWRQVIQWMRSSPVNFAKINFVLR